MKISLAFFKADKGNVLDQITALAGGGDFSHVELVFGEISKTSKCYSSSNTDNGTRFKTIDLTDGKWEIVEVLNHDVGKAERILQFCIRENGRAYDYSGLLYWVVGHLFKTEDSGKWFCSEVCTAALNVAGLFRESIPWKTSPGDLHKLAKAIAA